MQLQLTQRERLFLLALMVHEPPTDITNNDLKSSYGLDMKPDERTRLSGAGYLAAIRSRTPGRPYLYELTALGRERAVEELSGSAEPKSVINLRVLYALLNAVHQFLDRNHLPAGAIFAADKLGNGPVELDNEVIEAVTKEYRNLAEEPASWVPLRSLREALPTVERGELDDALRLLYSRRLIRLTSEANRRAISEADEAAALSIGGDNVHWMAIA
jgi:hypothetical protein